MIGVIAGINSKQSLGLLKIVQKLLWYCISNWLVLPTSLLATQLFCLSYNKTNALQKGNICLCWMYSFIGFTWRLVALSFLDVGSVKCRFLRFNLSLEQIGTFSLHFSTFVFHFSCMPIFQYILLCTWLFYNFCICYFDIHFCRGVIPICQDDDFLGQGQKRVTQT